jgi:hypothetical protein
MYVIIVIGCLTIALSSIMLLNPKAWSEGLLSFAKKSWFHIFEIATRLALGAGFFVFGSTTKFPFVMFVLGGLATFAGLLLIVIGSRKHREFAVRSAGFDWLFRPAGVTGILFGSFLIYAAVA